MKECLVCGNEFEDPTINHNKLYCNSKCKYKANLKQFQTYHLKYNRDYEKTPQRIAYKKRYNQLPQTKINRLVVAKRFMESEKGQTYHKAYRKKYNESEKGKEWRRKYNQSEKGKAIMKISHKKYHQTPKGKDMYKKYVERNREQLNKNSKRWRLNNPEEYLKIRKKYYHTPHGKEAILRVLTKRERNLSFNPIMNNPFPTEVRTEWHHINNMFVAPIPIKPHRKHKVESHRPKCNELLENFGFDLGVFT